MTSLMSIPNVVEIPVTFPEICSYISGVWRKYHNSIIRGFAPWDRIWLFPLLWLQAITTARTAVQAERRQQSFTWSKVSLYSTNDCATESSHYHVWSLSCSRRKDAVVTEFITDVITATATDPNLLNMPHRKSNTYVSLCKVRKVNMTLI